MNYFAHALPHLDDPYLAAASGVPDWLSVVDRKVRVRLAATEKHENDPDPITRSIARGIRQHLLDDRKFHATAAFCDTSLRMTILTKEVLGDDKSMRPAFLGHLLTELLLDDVLIARHPKSLQRYYEILTEVDVNRIQSTTVKLAGKPTNRLAPLILLFGNDRVLSDYAHDDTLFYRVSRVMRRVGLNSIPEQLVDTFPEARRLVEENADAMLEELPAAGCDRP